MYDSRKEDYRCIKICSDILNTCHNYQIDRDIAFALVDAVADKFRECMDKNYCEKDIEVPPAEVNAEDKFPGNDFPRTQLRKLHYIANSWTNRLDKLDENSSVYDGHGMEFTVGDLRAFNKWFSVFLEGKNQ